MIADTQLYTIEETVNAPVHQVVHQTDYNHAQQDKISRLLSTLSYSNLANLPERVFSSKSNYSISDQFQIDISKFTQKLKSMSRNSSAHQCAKYVRIALESAGAKFNNHPVAASDWGHTLTKIGYKQIEPSFDNPMEGDIYIIKKTNKHRYGHIAGFTGSQWVSDFKQRSYDVYKENNLTYQYYRPTS